ncbi:MAG: 5-amino-6-(D-ribitylamino)uracil--L-tyrosine 4-hydroxyphenyl transferase CofH [Promethearchaeota archaeon]
MAKKPGFEIDEMLQGGELSNSDALDLLKLDGSAALDLARRANIACEALHGKNVSFVVNRNINFTNVCTFNCRFCAFHTAAGSEDAFFLTPEDVAARTREAKKLEPDCSEICIQGGLHPEISIEILEEYLHAIKSVDKNIHVHGFSPQELWNMSKIEKTSIRETIDRLKSAGLGSVPGTAAEILVDDVRKEICPSKINTKRWIDVISTVHEAGLPSTSTIMYGHVESLDDLIKHLDVIRELQKKTGGFTEFVPLPFQSKGTVNPVLKERGRPADGMLDLKLHAVARLYFKGQIDNIQCSWVKLGVKFCQVLVNSGVNDFSGTLMEENITRLAGGTEGEYLDSRSMVMVIKQAGKTPIQRNTTYSIMKRY